MFRVVRLYITKDGGKDRKGVFMGLELKGFTHTSDGLSGKEMACKQCNTCDMHEFSKGADFPHVCRAGGETAADSLANGNPVSKCGEYEAAPKSSGKKGGGLGGFLGGKIKDAAMKDVRSIGRNIGRGL